MKVRPAGAELLNADRRTDGRTDGRTDMMKSKRTCKTKTTEILEEKVGKRSNA